MARVKTCCCCISLRIGCYVVAAYAMCNAVLQISIRSKQLSGKIMDDTTRTFTTLVLVLHATCLVSAIIMVVAVFFRKPKLLWPFVTVCSLLTFLLLIDITRTLVIFHKILIKIPHLVVFMIGDLVTLIINVYVVQVAEAYQNSGDTADKAEDHEMSGNVNPGQEQQPPPTDVNKSEDGF